MLIYRIANPEGTGRFYTGATEASKVAKEESRGGQCTVQVYEFATPKVVVDKETFLNALNQEAWCEPKLVAEFTNGKGGKVDD